MTSGLCQRTHRAEVLTQPGKSRTIPVQKCSEEQLVADCGYSFLYHDRRNLSICQDMLHTTHGAGSITIAVCICGAAQTLSGSWQSSRWRQSTSITCTAGSRTLCYAQRHGASWRTITTRARSRRWESRTTVRDDAFPFPFFSSMYPSRRYAVPRHRWRHGQVKVHTCTAAICCSRRMLYFLYSSTCLVLSCLVLSCIVCRSPGASGSDPIDCEGPADGGAEQILPLLSWLPLRQPCSCAAIKLSHCRVVCLRCRLL